MKNKKEVIWEAEKITFTKLGAKVEIITLLPTVTMKQMDELEKQGYEIKRKEITKGGK